MVPAKEKCDRKKTDKVIPKWGFALLVTQKLPQETTIFLNIFFENYTIPKIPKIMVLVTPTLDLQVNMYILRLHI